jgi:hypothetical protein
VPVLLQEGGKEVECHDNVLSELLIGHALVTGGNVEAGDLLELPLDGTSHIIDLLLEGLVVSTWLREHTNSVKNWTKDDWDLLDKSISGKEEGVFLGPLLDKLLVLVELLQLVHVDDIDTKVGSGNLVGVLLIGDQANLQVWSWDIWESNGSDETLILLRIIILEGNLELNSLGELSGLGLLSHRLDAVEHECVCNLGHFNIK